ncbi:hypothetical protein CQA01_02130 [Cyclobacterium qasimii]|uniref:Uncharacterized protein n=1 Tax=Cyclobacterium qasimii TaxID=1350429 RepID=A0A512C642_9BACT|nr:hypothetical protein CQA01_02130 [Cyclobacterium qasimii]
MLSFNLFIRIEGLKFAQLLNLNMNTLKWLSLSILINILVFAQHANAQEHLLERLASPVIFAGNDSVAYRDPAVLFHDVPFTFIIRW